LEREIGKGNWKAGSESRRRGGNLETLLSHEDLLFMAQRYHSIIDLLSQQIKMIEKKTLDKLGLTEQFLPSPLMVWL